jgi:hypothetical protein
VTITPNKIHSKNVVGKSQLKIESMKKIFSTAIVILALSVSVMSQDVGLSFSYFIPKNGYFSTPISPFSIRGLGVNLNRFVSLETGVSLYRMSGLNLKDLPVQTKSPLIGPNFTILVPAEIVFTLQGTKVQFDIKGGGFFFYGFDQKINYGNFDRAVRDINGWSVANGELSFKNKPGFGYHGGAELTVYVTSQVGVSIETNYLVGQAKFPITGTYTGGVTSVESIPVDYPEAKVDFTGFEFSLGLIFNSGAGGGPKKPASKRRRR